MSTSSTVSAPAPRIHPADKFTWEKTAQGDVTMLTMHGTLNEGFEAKKLSDAVKTKKVVISMADIRRIASWGMAEWMEFLRRLGDRDVYLVECSTYAMSQLNLVTGLLGHSKLVSFYSTYLCSGCGKASNSLFIIPRDRAIIKDLPGSEYQCSSCGSSARLEEYPAAFFDTLASRDGFEIDDEVLAFFRAQLKYDLVPDLARGRALGAEEADIAYIRVSGELARVQADKITQAARTRTIIDLEGAIFDDSGIDAWEACMDGVLPKVTSLQLNACPPGFLESAIALQDLRDKVKVRSFALAYDCTQCSTRTVQEIDVAANLEELVTGRVPQITCPGCKARVLAVLSPDLTARLRALPARDRDPVLEKFFAKSRALPAIKLANLLTGTTRPPPPAPVPTGRKGLYVALALAVVALGGVTWVAIGARNQRAEDRIVTTPPPADAGPVKPTFSRPEWITADMPSSSYCLDMINRVMCVGVSSYRANRDEAVAEASDAALDELVNTVALKITDPYFKENLAPLYGTNRNTQIGVLHAAEAERTGPVYREAQQSIEKTRHRVATALRASGSAAVPAQRSDWHWEAYAGEPMEQLVFVRYDVTVDALRSLSERYSVPTDALGGATLVTAFPGRAWEVPELASGAVVVKPGRQLARAGVKPQSIIMSVDDEPVADAFQLARVLEAADKANAEISLKLKPVDGDVTTVKLKL